MLTGIGSRKARDHRPWFSEPSNKALGLLQGSAMFKKSSESHELARFGDMPAFLSILLEQHKAYQDFINNRPSLDDLEPESIIRLNQNQIDPLYISTLFAAMFLEAYIYDYGARKKSASYIDNYIDKLDPPSKWVVITQLFNSSGLDPSTQAYQKLKTLFSYRNGLAHNKSKSVSGLDDISKMTPKLFKPFECLEIIWMVMTELKKIDPEEIYAGIVINQISSVRKAYP